MEKNNSSNTNDLAALRGAQLVSAIETSAGKRLAEALVKELTGQDAVTARFLYQEFFTFLPVFKLWLACNHVPVIQGQDFAIWRRIRLIPFNVQFQDADHPIRAGAVIGTANGTVINADRLFRRFKLPRHAEVDSEVIVRLAHESIGLEGRLNIHSLAQRLAMCKGSIAAVMVAKTEPGRVVMVKGNKPLEMMYSARYRVILYASDMNYIRHVVGKEPGWAEMTIPRNALVAVETSSLKIAETVPVGWKGNSTLCV